MFVTTSVGIGINTDYIKHIMVEEAKEGEYHLMVLDIDHQEYSIGFKRSEADAMDYLNELVKQINK